MAHDKKVVFLRPRDRLEAADQAGPVAVPPDAAQQRPSTGGGFILAGVEFLRYLLVVLLMFLAGLETDPQGLRTVGRTAFAVAVGGVVLPMAAGYGAGKLAGMETTFTIKRSDFGSTYGVPAISDDVELTVSLEGAGG